VSAPSPLGRAATAADAEDADRDARLRFYALLQATTLNTPLEDAEDADGPKPMVFQLSGGSVALAFDDDARLAAFFGRPTRYVATPGRVLVGLLAEAGLGLAVNPGDDGGAVLPAETLAWIASEMSAPAEAAELSGPLAVAPPLGAPAGLVEALAARVAGTPGVLEEAWLVRLGPDGAPGSLAALLLPTPAGRRAAEGLANWLAPVVEALAPAGETASVGLLAHGHPLLAPARNCGLPLHGPPAPARPDKPPQLRYTGPRNA